MLLTGLNLYAQDSNAPDMALLEFLGEGVKVGNGVVDPLTWQAMQDMTGADRHDQQQVRQTQDARQQASGQQKHE